MLLQLTRAKILIGKYDPKIVKLLLSRITLQIQLMASDTAKRLCTENNNGIKIGTHDGAFHCDDALACYMLKTLPQYKNATIIRSRKDHILSQCDVIVDVGGVFDPNTHRYDHHQRSFTESVHSLMPGKEWETKLSSAGLVYVHFGHQIIGNLLNKKENDDVTRVVFDKVYQHFIQEIDAIDNGIAICDGTPKYKITTDVSSRVANLRPNWKEPPNDEDMYRRFEAAMELVGKEFEEKVRYYGEVWWSAREVIVTAIEDRYNVDSIGEIIELPKGGVPWKEHLLDLEKELNVKPSIKFVLFTDTNGSWRVQCVPNEGESFSMRVPLYREWQGLREEQLSSKSQIDGCVFVHSTGFIGGNRTRHGSLEMARKSLLLTKSDNQKSNSVSNSLF